MQENREGKIKEASSVLKGLGMPQGQQNLRSALCLLALLELSPEKEWNEASNPLMGITPIMNWIMQNYRKTYAPNTRETVRRQTMHQFVQAGIALYNPDQPDRAVNSPYAVYQIEPICLNVLHHFGKPEYESLLKNYLSQGKTLAQKYAMQRELIKIPVVLAGWDSIKLSPGAHSELIGSICMEFVPRFIPGGRLMYIGDTGGKWAYVDEELLANLGLSLDEHGKMPDAVIYDEMQKWLILAEAVTSHGPVNAKRHAELQTLFAACKAGLVYLTAFPNRRIFTRYAEDISWETEVWIADNPGHLIHFNGSRYLGPY